MQRGGQRKLGEVHLLNVEKGPAIRLTAQGKTRLRVLAKKVADEAAAAKKAAKSKVSLLEALEALVALEVF